MTNRLVYLFFSLLLLVACGGKEGPEYVPNPAIELSFKSFQEDGVVLEIKSLNTDAVYVVVLPLNEDTPTAEMICEQGEKTEGKEMFIGHM